MSRDYEFWHFRKDHVNETYERCINFNIHVEQNSTVITGLGYKNFKPFTGIYVHSPHDRYSLCFYIDGALKRLGDLPTTYSKSISTIDGLEIFEYRWEKYNQSKKTHILHRTTGPAAIMIIGHPEISRLNFWYINGVNVTAEITEWTKENGIDVNNLSEEDKQFIKMKWDT